MAIFGMGNANASNISATAVALSVQLREAAIQAAQLNDWLSAQSDADLEGAGFTASDLAMVRSAVADANAIAQILNTGLPPDTYPQPPSAYIYANSMRQIIGPG